MANIGSHVTLPRGGRDSKTTLKHQAGIWQSVVRESPPRMPAGCAVEGVADGTTPSHHSGRSRAIRPEREISQCSNAACPRVTTALPRSGAGRAGALEDHAVPLYRLVSKLRL